MTTFSGYVALLWLVPVVLQILLPLVCFVGWGLGRLLIKTFNVESEKISEPAVLTAAS